MMNFLYFFFVVIACIQLCRARKSTPALSEQIHWRSRSFCHPLGTKHRFRSVRKSSCGRTWAANEVRWVPQNGQIGRGDRAAQWYCGGPKNSPLLSSLFLHNTEADLSTPGHSSIPPITTHHNLTKLNPSRQGDILSDKYYKMYTNKMWWCGVVLWDFLIIIPLQVDHHCLTMFHSGLWQLYWSLIIIWSTTHHLTGKVKFVNLHNLMPNWFTFLLL